MHLSIPITTKPRFNPSYRSLLDSRWSYKLPEKYLQNENISCISMTAPKALRHVTEPRDSLIDLPSGTPIFDLCFQSLFGGFLSNSTFQLVTLSNKTDVLTVKSSQYIGISLSSPRPREEIDALTFASSTMGKSRSPHPRHTQPCQTPRSPLSPATTSPTRPPCTY